MAKSRSVGRHAKHVAWRKVDDEIVILDLDSSMYFSLNKTGGRVWELVGKGLSEDMISEELAGDYGKSAKAIKKDVSALVRKLKKNHLIT